MATLHAQLSFLTHQQHNTKQNHDQYSDHQQLLSLIDRCYDLKQVKRIHAHLLRVGHLFFDPYLAGRLVALSSFSPFSSLDYARKVFDQIPQPNLITWNTLIRAYASSRTPDHSLLIFSQMLHQCPDPPNKYTYPFAIKAASELSALREGRVFHGTVIKASLGSDIFILNSLIHFYASCGQLDEALKVFLKIPNRDVVSWNSMITAYSQSDYPEKALELFRGMEMDKVKPNDVTMVGVLSACAKNLDLEFGRWVHSYIERNEIDMDLILSNVLLDMYTKCLSLEEAKRMFDKMPEKDCVSWTTMIVGYARSGEFDAARCVFDMVPNRDIAAWNALISAYEQSGRPKEALSLFHELQVAATVKPDQLTLVSVLSACSQLGAMDLGGWIHIYIKKQGLKLNCHLTTSLIDMYSKCGDIDKALEVFRSMEQKDVYVWSAMIAGLAMHGCGRAAVALFLQMQKAKVKPNAVTFTNLLCACSHAGLVEKGRLYFNQMLTVYGVAPEAKHYTCMVDILGRAGLLKEAVELIEKMPIAPAASVWGALLGACGIHGDVELAENACKHVLELEPRNHGAYVLMSNIYAKLGKWDAVSRLRKLMRNVGIKKEPGYSSVEINGVVHEFLVGDNSHPLSKKIYFKLAEIVSRLKSIGYVPNKDHLLQNVEEGVAKENALYLHSEKLAIAFGLISTDYPTPVRIVKNLRICGDCHSVAKLISQFYDREILLRDRYRFHHFKEGHCSCMDYW